MKHADFAIGIEFETDRRVVRRLATACTESTAPADRTLMIMPPATWSGVGSARRQFPVCRIRGM